MKTLLTIQTLIILFLVPQVVNSQVAIISGYVKNSLTNKVLVNAAVFEKNSQTGTITDSKGFYRLYLKKGDIELQFSQSSFVNSKKSFRLAADTVVSVLLTPGEVLIPVSEGEQLNTTAAQKNEKHRRRFLLF